LADYRREQSLWNEGNNSIQKETFNAEIRNFDWHNAPDKIIEGTPTRAISRDLKRKGLLK
jgi:hypothetical protein